MPRSHRESKSQAGGHPGLLTPSQCSERRTAVALQVRTLKLGAVNGSDQTLNITSQCPLCAKPQWYLKQVLGGWDVQAVEPAAPEVGEVACQPARLF